MDPAAPPLFAALTEHATEAEIEAAAGALIRDAHDRALCRETRLMLAENYRRAAEAQDGPRATALRWAANSLRTET